jgi:hypothetical protein
MALEAQEQLRLGLQAITTGDVNLASRLLTDPDTLTIDDQRSVAENLGIKRGFASAAVNTFSDHVVWMALLMSRRFPTLSWLRGSIPTRFVGAANEWTGINRYTRPVEEFFRGTPIPKLTALKQIREAKVLRLGEDMFRIMQRPNWKEEMPTVSLLLEGVSDPRATPELVNVARQLRGKMDDLWGLLRGTQMVGGGFQGDAITKAWAKDWPLSRAPRYLRDYLPHIPLTGDESVMELSGRRALTRMMGGKRSQALALKGQDPGAVWRPSEADELSSRFSDYQTFLNNVGSQIFAPNLFHRRRMDVPLASAKGQEWFVTDLNTVLQKYVHSVARTYAVNAPLTAHERSLATIEVLDDVTGLRRRVTPSAEPISVQVMNLGLDSLGTRFIRRRVAGTDNFEFVMDPSSGSPLGLTALRHLQRAVTGRSDEAEIMWGNLISSVANRFHRYTGRISRKQEAYVAGTLDAAHRN